MMKQKRKIGYTAKAFRFGGWLSPMKMIEAYVAHKNPPVDVMSLRKKVKFVWVTTRIARQTMRETASGVRQYPSTQTDWKKDLKQKRCNQIVKNSFASQTYMFPPNSLEFNVTTIAPIQTITNTSANSGPPSFECASFADPCRIVAIKVHNTNGPHKSHSFKRLFFSFGQRTCLNLLPTARTSLS